jgi:hypothetical protein
METSAEAFNQRVSRRSFLRGALYGTGSVALYAGEFERHWLEVVRKDIRISR